MRSTLFLQNCSISGSVIVSHQSQCDNGDSMTLKHNILAPTDTRSFAKNAFLRRF